MTSLADDAARVESLSALSRFRGGFHACLPRRADALFELCDAMLCTDGPVTSLPELTLLAEHQRGHGAMYDALNHGRIDIGRLRWSLASLPLPRAADGRIVLAVDVSPWLRPDAPTSPNRLFCHVYGRSKNTSQFIPGWPYSFVTALETGRTSWTQVLDAVRLGPADDATATTAAQLREVITRLITAGHWRQGEADIVIVMDSGYDVCRLAFVLADLPVQLVGRLRSDRLMLQPAPPYRPSPTSGRPRKHGPAFTLAEPGSWHTPEHTSTCDTSRYGTAEAMAWERMHPRLSHRGPWLEHEGDLPIVEGTLIRLQVEYLPGDRDPKPVWLWSSATGADDDHVDRLWQAFLRRFDLEHTFRLFKQTLGWSAPRLRSPEAADRWTWLVIAAHTQLWLARPLAEDLRRPWERAARPGRLTPARVRRGFRHLRVRVACPAGAPKPCRPGPGRPLGSGTRRRAFHHGVGKTVKRAPSLEAHHQSKG